MSTSDTFNRTHGYTECRTSSHDVEDCYDYVTIQGGKYLALEIDTLRETIQELQETIQNLQEQIHLCEPITPEEEW